MKKLFILCVVLVARIHAESSSIELDEDREDYDSDEDSYVALLEGQHQQEVDTEDEDNESSSIELNEDSEDYDSDEDSSVPLYVVEDMEAQHQQEVENGGEDNEVLSFFTKEYDQVVDDCRVETGYTNEVVAKEKASYFSENTGLRIFNYCFLEKTGVVTRDGKLNFNNIPAKVTSSFPETFMKCISRGKKYPVSFFFQCFHWKVSLYMRMTDIDNVIRAFTENSTPIVDACRMETGYTDEVIAEEEKNNLNKDAGLKKFNNCFLKKTGFEADEKFDIDDALGKMPQSNFDDIIKICELKTTKKIIPDRVPFLSACLHLEVSNYFRSKQLYKFSVLPETEHIIQIVDVCRMETGFTDDVLYKEQEDNFTEEEGLRKFNNCFLDKTGVINNGKLNIDAALAKLPPSFAKPIIEHCQANIILKYITDSVHDFSTCYLHALQSRFPLALFELYMPLNHTKEIAQSIEAYKYTINYLKTYGPQEHYVYLKLGKSHCS